VTPEMPDYRAPKGTKDILPAESPRWDAFFAAVERVYQAYGFGRIETPIFEAESLFARGIGDGTDIVNKEMYSFADKGERMMALRPEETAGVVRAYLEHNLGQTAPLVKVHYRGPMFRYERPQGGRQRQFWQVGVEAIGSAEPALDAEVIDCALESLTAAGLEDIALQVNSVGCPKCRPAYTAALSSYILDRSAEFCETCLDRAGRNPMRAFDCKNPACAAALKEAPLIRDFLCEDCSAHFGDVKAALQAIGVDYNEDPRLVRGLDYYTKTAFEITSAGLGAQDAVAAGGRYDGLIEQLGGPSTPGIGFAVGVERVLLASAGQAAPVPAPDVYVVTLGKEAGLSGLAVAKTLRRSGFSVVADFSGKPLKKQMSGAAKANARFALIIGEDELTTGAYVIKNLTTGDQTAAGPEDLAGWLTENS
jgi:histidyl-tRNA synthetase